MNSTGFESQICYTLKNMSKTSLVSETQKLNKILTRLEKRYSLINSFLRGVASGLGSVIGATLVFAFLAYLLRNVEVVPLIGAWLAELIEQSMQN